MRLKRKLVFCCLLVLASAASSPRSAFAIFVLKKGSAAPLMGQLVRADERAVVIREELTGGKTRDVTIPRGEIEELIETVSRERLAELDPAEPTAYFEYAEELAEKRRDPEARDTARRLLIIAASRGELALTQSSLLLLADLARNDDERRRIRALIYLHDPRQGASRLVLPELPASDSPSAQGDLLAALRLIRQGQGAAAKAILEQAAIQEELARENLSLTGPDLLALTGQRMLADDDLARILRAEMSLEQATSAEPRLGHQSWSTAARTRGLAPLAPLDIRHLTEFDPAECVFRQDKWQRP